MQFDVLMVGGGFSGTMLAVHLLRQSSSLSIAVLDRGVLPGRGLAYNSPHRFHLLNVPAGEMSAFPDVPDDFLRWARAHFDSEVRERSFPPRSVFGQYVGDILERTRLDQGRERFRWVRERALSLHTRRRGLAVQAEDGLEILARAVVLATGNFPPADPRVTGRNAMSPPYFRFPRSQEALGGLESLRSILLLGSGLTSVDCIMELKSRGFRGPIHVLSRKGLFPRARRQVRPSELWPPFWNRKSPRNTRGLFRLVREQVRVAAEKGIDWRAVIDSLRPLTNSIWAALSIEERRRFLRHARVYWDVHRHRVAPEISDLLFDMRTEGQVCLHAGVLTKYFKRGNAAEIKYRDRDSGSERTLEIDRVINCSGSETDYRRIDDPFIISLFVQGLARPNQLFLGLDADEDGRLLDSDGKASRFLWAIGPTRKGCLWETTTVSEIRQQAVDIAQHLVEQLGNTRCRTALLAPSSRVAS